MLTIRFAMVPNSAARRSPGSNTPSRRIEDDPGVLDRDDDRRHCRGLRTRDHRLGTQSLHGHAIVVRRLSDRDRRPAGLCNRDPDRQFLGARMIAPQGARRLRRAGQRPHFTEQAMRIGFLGLGNMGRAMAANLLRGGHQIRAWNRSAAAAAQLSAMGADAVATPGAAFDADVVFTMLADDAALREVLIDSGLLDRLSPPLIHVNMATISVALAGELASLWALRGVAYVAAPVMGRPDAAAGARLNILAAGPNDAVEGASLPLLALMGQKTWRFGEQAQIANAVKLTVNFMLAAAVETFGEATVLAEAHGVAPQQLFDLLTSTLFPGPVHQGYGDLIVRRRSDPAGFKAALALKDLRLALTAAETVSVPLPIGAAVRDSLTDAVAHEEGEMDLAVLGRGAARRGRRWVRAGNRSPILPALISPQY